MPRVQRWSKDSIGRIQLGGWHEPVPFLSSPACLRNESRATRKAAKGELHRENATLCCAAFLYRIIIVLLSHPFPGWGWVYFPGVMEDSCLFNKGTAREQQRDDCNIPNLKPGQKSWVSGSLPLQIGQSRDVFLARTAANSFWMQPEFWVQLDSAQPVDLSFCNTFLRQSLQRWDFSWISQ